MSVAPSFKKRIKQVLFDNKLIKPFFFRSTPAVVEMRVMVTDGLIETPQKNFDSPYLENRSKPSKYASASINRMLRCHYFLKHSDRKFVNLKLMLLTPSISREVAELMKDIKPRCIDLFKDLEVEELARNNETDGFTIFLEGFLAEQLSVPKKHSFASFLVFQYRYMHDLSVEDAFYDLFCLYSKRIKCKECHYNYGEEVPQDLETHNLHVLQSLQSEDVLDDSINDPEFNIDSNYTTDTSIQENSTEIGVNLNLENNSGDDSDYFINPFAAVSSNFRMVNMKENPDIDEEVRDSCNRCSPVREVPVHSTPKKADNQTVCEYCEKDFKKVSNLKTHLGIGGSQYCSLLFLVLSSKFKSTVFFF